MQRRHTIEIALLVRECSESLPAYRRLLYRIVEAYTRCILKQEFNVGFMGTEGTIVEGVVAVIVSQRPVDCIIGKKQAHDLKPIILGCGHQYCLARIVLAIYEACKASFVALLRSMTKQKIDNMSMALPIC